MATDSENVQPQLLAFLICDDIMLENEVVTLWRVADVFNFQLTVPASVSDEERDKTNVQLNTKIFTRWGPPGAGSFKQQLGLVTPDGNEVHRPEPQNFTMSGGYGFSQTIWDVHLGIRTEGTYTWVLYLNDSEIARLPFQVNITRQTPPTT